MAPQHENEDFYLCGQCLNVQIENTREQLKDGHDFVSTQNLCCNNSIPSLSDDSLSSGTFETIQISYYKARTSNDVIFDHQSNEPSTLRNSFISFTDDDYSDVSDLYYIGSDLQYTFTPDDLSFIPEPKLCLCNMLDQVKILIFGFDDDLDC